MFLLTITTVDKILFRGNVFSVNCPGSEGELTVLPNHTALVTTLVSGEIRVKGEHEALTFPLTRGILEVSHNEATILL